jgi:hypothetical protein
LFGDIIKMSHKESPGDKEKLLFGHCID